MIDKWTQIAESPEAAAILKLTLRINQICDQEGDAKKFLPNLLHQLAQILDVQTVVVTVNDPVAVQSIFSRYDRREAEALQSDILELAIQITDSQEWIESATTFYGFKNFLGIPIKKLDHVLGSLILGNKSSGDFTEYDRMVLTMVEARLHNVIDDWQKLQEYKILTIENRVLKELDRIRDEGVDHGVTLDKMISVILDAIKAQIGFVTLYDQEKDSHLPGGKVLRGTRPLSQNDYKLVGDLIRHAKEDHKTLLTEKVPESEIDSIIVVPMFMAGIFVGSVVLINKENSLPFSSDDQRIVESVTNMVDSYIFQEERFKRLMMLVGSEASRDVEESMMGRRPDISHGQRMEITMLFADIRDYSKKTKDMEPDIIVRMLNDYFNAITPIITSHSGIVDKYVGDEVVALFTKSTSSGNHQYLAVEAALAIQAELERVNREWELTGRPTIQVGIGIHTGMVVLGQIGSYERKDYTAIGTHMNFAARLQAIAGANQTVISETTYIGLTGKITARRIGPFNIKSFGDVMAYLIEGRSPEHF
jgi:class 3 adenylate cyclase